MTLSDGSLLVAGKGCAAFCNEEEAAAGLVSFLPERDGGKSCEDILLARGSKYSKGGDWGSHVVVDGRIITGQNPASAAGVGAAIVAAL